MIKFLLGKLDCGRRLIEKLNSLKLESPFKEWAEHSLSRYFLTGDVRLTVKPMYADDLWWNIWDASDNKNEPLSLRGTGAYSLSGQILTSDEITKVADKGELTNII